MVSSSVCSAEEIARQLCDFLRDNILAPSVAVTSDTDLSSIGVDSFSLMEVILFIERRFGLVLPAESLTPQNIANVGALSRHCAKLMDGADV